ncbi:MAG TPA: hypothetical protein VG672_25020 [Bryobacteraceae bacterium]|nr:hypothetical protein [Bryobacteraceae bacterium]
MTPASVPGSGSATGTVKLNEPVPTGGIVISLWTNGSPAFATLGTITAFLNGQSVTTTITVTP